MCWNYFKILFFSIVIFVSSMKWKLHASTGIGCYLQNNLLWAPLKCVSQMNTWWGEQETVKFNVPIWRGLTWEHVVNPCSCGGLLSVIFYLIFTGYCGVLKSGLAKDCLCKCLCDNLHFEEHFDFYVWPYVVRLKQKRVEPLGVHHIGRKKMI